MHRSDWSGVFPAITTPFDERLAVDHDALKEHVAWLARTGSRGIVALGSLGEGATLSYDEKVAVFKSCRAGLGGKIPLIASIAALSTAEAVALARDAERAGCDGLMVLPPYVYRPDEREADAHFRAVIGATKLSCMLYNNPIAYGTDVTPAQLASLVRHENLHAVKDSSGDIRRLTAIGEELGERLAVFVGLDDCIVEGIAAGAVGWVAGLVNALPEESVRLFELASAGQWEDARALYHWFLPLLRLDTGIKFVQLIKLVQQEMGHGSERVRPPRLALAGAERDEALALIRAQFATRPAAMAAR